MSHNNKKFTITASGDASGSESEDEKLNDNTVNENQVVLHLPSAHLAERFSRHVGICERTMWELSTLGGAFASMSCYASKWANHLLKVSTFQLLIAQKLQNELYEGRARIFLANAFASNGHYEKAGEIIVKELNYVKLNLKDDTILKVATAMKTRIRNMKSKTKAFYQLLKLKETHCPKMDHGKGCTSK